MQSFTDCRFVHDLTCIGGLQESRGRTTELTADLVLRLGDVQPDTDIVHDLTCICLQVSRGRAMEPKVDLVLRPGDVQPDTDMRQIQRDRVEVTRSLKEQIENLRQSLYHDAQTASDQVETDFEDMVVKVRRGAHIVDDTLEIMGNWTTARWRQGVVVHFEGELGIDCGALTREWAKILCQQLLRPGRGLFRRTARGNRVVILADQESELAHGESTEGIYCFLGRFIAFALWRGIRIDAVFTPLLYRLMIDPHAKATHEDLREVDPKLHANLHMMLTCERSMIEDTFCQSFCIDTEFLGVRSTYDLVPNGSQIPVTGDNVHKFVDLYVQHVLYEFSKNALRAFLYGFHSLVSPTKMVLFTASELEAVVCGQPAIRYFLCLSHRLHPLTSTA